MKEIEYLPKFYDRKDIIAKQREVEACIKELLASQKLTRKEIEEISDFDIM